MQVKAKKHLGQHFLTDENIAKRIVDSLDYDLNKTVLEIGAGMGVLSKYLFDKQDIDFHIVEIDDESVEYLQNNYITAKNPIINEDFLKFDLDNKFENNIAVIGNFPYNISSQIMFKVLDHKNKIDQVVGMFQKEVAQRFASKPGSKQYGIISVLLQAYYDVEYLFTVGNQVFDPPPKVDSAVISFKRNKVSSLDCDDDLFKKIVKTSFNQRRKKISNSIKSLITEKFESPLLDKRPEQLSVEEFIQLTKLVYGKTL
jgi:16S rRNA (adenine1518-N6/adenine1519-N6)-dimethyltransferase